MGWDNSLEHPDPGIKPASHSSCTGRQALYHERHLGKPRGLCAAPQWFFWGLMENLDPRAWSGHCAPRTHPLLQGQAAAPAPRPACLPVLASCSRDASHISLSPQTRRCCLFRGPKSALCASYRLEHGLWGWLQGFKSPPCLFTAV